MGNYPAHSVATPVLILHPSAGIARNKSNRHTQAVPRSHSENLISNPLLITTALPKAMLALPPRAP